MSPKISDFLNNERFMAARHKEGFYVVLKKKYPYIFLCAKVHLSMTSGCRGTPYFRRYDSELVLKPAISFKKIWGGYRRTTSSGSY